MNRKELTKEDFKKIGLRRLMEMKVTGKLDKKLIKQIKEQKK